MRNANIKFKSSEKSAELDKSSSGRYIFKIVHDSRTIEVPCTQIDVIIYRRAKRLYEQVKLFPGSSDFKCTPYKPRMVAYVESEDAVDEVQPEFNDVQKGIVNDHFQHLHRMYGATMDHGLYNCIGKDFLHISAMYIKHCFIDPNKLMNIWCLSSTAKGKFQPGALFLNWSLPKRPLRDSNDENLRYTIPHEKYADNVVYDSEKKSTSSFVKSKWMLMLLLNHSTSNRW